MTDPATPTTDHASHASAPAPAQSVRIETELWWEDGTQWYDNSDLFVGPKRGADGTRLVTIVHMHGLMPNPWKWCYLAKLDPRQTWHEAPTREAAKAEALQAVMDAIGAREVGATI